MQYATIHTALVLLGSQALAMPYNETHAPEIAARDANYCYYDLPPSSVGGGYGYAFTININGQTCPSAQGTGAVGGGLLDNLRGQVGASYIENWQADTGSDSGLIATFGIPSSVTTDAESQKIAGEVDAAIQMATNPSVSIPCGLGD